MITKTTICPGCSINCGLYLEIDEGEPIRVDHRKCSPVNEGKLCRFGMNLPSYYRRERLENSIDGKPVEREKAIEEARKRIRSIDPKEMAFVSLSNTTCEELASFMSLSKSLGCDKMEFGLNNALKLIHDGDVLRSCLPFEEIEKYEKIALFFFNPFVQYPLILRRILRSKKIINVSFEKDDREIADEEILLDAREDISSEMEKIRNNKEVFRDALIISEISPYSNPHVLMTMLWLKAAVNAELLFMKPYSSAVSGELLRDAYLENSSNMSLLEMMDAIEDGSIKALYLLETDIGGVLLLREDEIRNKFSNLELLIEQNAFKTASSDVAGITLSSELFFDKRGMVINAEGRLMENQGSSEEGLKIIEGIARGVGEERSYDEIHKEVLDKLGVSRVKETEVQIRTERRSLSIEGVKEMMKKIEKGKKEKGDYLLLYRTNPFFWHGISTRNFVEISVELARDLKLYKDDKIVIEGENGGEIKDYRISDYLPEYLVISEDKITSVSNKALSGVRIRRAR